MEALEVKFYYDLKSAFTNLALRPTFQLEKSHRVRLRYIPFDFDIRAALGGDLAERSEWGWRKVRYSYLDARRFANKMGLVLRGPERIYDSRQALMGGLLADRHGLFQPYALRVMGGFFRRELDLEDPGRLEAIAAEVGLDAAEFRRYLATDGPSELAACVPESDRDGIFGVPTYVVTGEPFWGLDRLPLVIEKLDAMGLKR